MTDLTKAASDVISERKRQIEKEGYSTHHDDSCRDIPSCFTVLYDDFGDYSPGRWAWLLRDVKALDPPAKMKGAQGFFDLPQGWLCGGGR